MKKINLNAMAKDICAQDGLKEQVNIAQVKEILRITLAKLADEWFGDNASGVVELISKS